MRALDTAVLGEIGPTLYERQALLTLMVSGVADAATLCREGDIPTSKIYRSMEKLRDLGLGNRPLFRQGARRGAVRTARTHLRQDGRPLPVRAAFDVGLDGPSAVRLTLVPDLGGTGSLILAVAYEDGGTGRGWADAPSLSRRAE